MKKSLLLALLIASLPTDRTLLAQPNEVSPAKLREIPDPDKIPLAPTDTRGANLRKPDQPLKSNEPLEPKSAPAEINPDEMLSPGGLNGTLKVLLLLTVLSLAPAILIMTTCFVRFVIVFGLLRQAIGTQQLPPNQVLVSLSLFLTLLVMAPVWQEAHKEGIQPYTNQTGWAAKPMTEEEALDELFTRTTAPLRRFMVNQIDETGNADAIWLFLEYQKPDPDTPEGKDWKPPEDYKDVPLSALLPAFLISELKTAFLIGFQIYLPFLVIDLVVSSVLISMGMMMLPPVLISIPIKLMLFVLIDGWFLTVGMVLESVAPP